MSIPLYEHYPVLAECRDDIEKAKERIIRTFRAGGKLLACGNGGSCADCDHIVGELMKGFLSARTPDEGFVKEIGTAYGEHAAALAGKLQNGLPAISLPAQSAVLSATANDNDAETIYGQLILGYAKPEDLLLCLSTSGNSKNVVFAAQVAKTLGVPVISMTGKKESKLSEISDVTIRVPETETYRVQELHLPVYHYLCAEVEREFFEKG